MSEKAENSARQILDWYPAPGVKTAKRVARAYLDLLSLSREREGEKDNTSAAAAAPFDHNKRRGPAMSTAQQILPNLVEELRTEAGMRHGDGAEESLEWRAAERLLAAHVILQTWVNVSADLSADPLPKPLREIQDDEQALLIRAQEWCRRMGPLTAEEADRFRWESHDWSPDTHTCRKCGAAISTKEACPGAPIPDPESEPVSDERDGTVAERSASQPTCCECGRTPVVGLDPPLCIHCYGRDALRKLADAADDVGVKFFDTDTMDPLVEKMQAATEAARRALKGGK
jgi:hypothetical protein